VLYTVKPPSVIPGYNVPRIHRSIPVVSGQILLCKIRGFHGGDYEECRSSGLLRRVAVLRTDVSEKLSASFIRVKRISELGTLAVTSNRLTLRASIASYS
jgi:hypothetical protein